MKNWLFLITLILGGGQIMASTQPPETIYPLTRELKSLNYYVEQAQLWEQVTLKQPNDPNAWVNYYTAARNANALSSKTFYNQEIIVANAAEAIKGTFEHYYLAFWESGIKNKRFDDLLKAHQLAPDRPEVFHDMVTYYEIRGEQEKVKAYCQKMYEADVISNGILNWNYNALMSVEPESILLVHGDNDTYPALLLQHIHGVQPKVKVVNTFLLQFYPNYRDRLFKELGVPSYQATEIQTEEDIIQKQYRLLIHLIKNSSLPVYFGIAVMDDLRQKFDEQLYLTGLAFLHFDKTIDNVAILRNNFENKFRKDDLFQPLSYDKSQSVINHINMNYIPLLVMLYQNYLSSGSTDKANAVKQLCLTIAERNNSKARVAAYFQEPQEIKPFKSVIDIKAIEKLMMKVDENKYASAFETTNAQYEHFLMDLLQQKEFGKLETCKIYPADWKSYLPETYQNQPEEVLFENGHPEEDNMPIVNITLEAAQMYCEWLTIVYNQSTHKKKRHKKVRFYIPSNEEWTKAAKGKYETAIYPWGGYGIANAKRCYLANFNPYKPKKDLAPYAPENESPGEDGGFFPVSVDAYFPNDQGLYNLSGNVAEMVKGGWTKGGSWLEAAKYLNIDEKHEQNIPSPAVGFRVFMEVIE